jgi:hypothetical protein
MRNAHLTADLFEDFGLESSEWRLAVFHASAWRGPVTQAVSLADEKNTTRRIEKEAKTPIDDMYDSRPNEY